MERIDADGRSRVSIFICVYPVDLWLESFWMSALGARRPSNGLAQGCTSYFGFYVKSRRKRRYDEPLSLCLVALYFTGHDFEYEECFYFRDLRNRREENLSDGRLALKKFPPVFSVFSLVEI
jgi:hypothetical protein